MFTLDQLLREVARSVDLSASNRERAESSYETIGSWLEHDNGPFASLHPNVFPQGSMRLGTAINPYNGTEFDVDGVLELDRVSIGSTQLIATTVEWLRSHGSYQDKVEPIKRGARVRYARGFHFDAIPAVRESHGLLVADGCGGWEFSDPKGYAAWFQSKCATTGSGSIKAMEPLPNVERFDDKDDLKLSAQLFKRARDVYFGSDSWLPASILLTTIVALQVPGRGLPEQLLASVDHATRLDAGAFVPNPTNPTENLARQLADQQLHSEFHSFAKITRDRLQALRATAGLDAKLDLIRQLFGDGPQIDTAESIQSRINESRSSGTLLYGALSGFGLATGRQVPHQDFHGSDGR